MIRIAVQKTLLHKPEFHTIQEEALVSDLVNEYLGNVAEHAVVVVSGVCVDRSQFANTIVESGDIAYLSVQTPEATLTPLDFVYLAFIAFAAYKYTTIDMDIPENNETQAEKQKRIDGLRNGPRKYEPLPIVLGTHRVTPDWAAAPFAEVIGDKQYYNLLLCGGYGPQEIDDFCIGDTAYSEYEDIQISYYDGYTSAFHEGGLRAYNDISDLKSKWSNDIVQESVSVEVPNTSGTDAATVTRTSAPDSDYLSMEFSFPQGLVHIEEGEEKETLVQLDITATNNTTGRSYKLAKAVPYRSSSSQTYSAYAGDILYDLDNPGTIYQCNWGMDEDYVYEGANGGYRRFRGNERPSGTIQISSSYINHYDPATKIISLETGSIATDRARYTISKKSRDAFFVGLKHDFDPEFPADTYNVVVSVSKQSHSANTRNITHWESLTSYRPLTTEEFEKLVGAQRPAKNIDGVFHQTLKPVIIAVRIKATNQLSGMLDKFNYLAKSVVPKTTEWNTDWRLLTTLPRTSLNTSSNPADIYRLFLQGPFNANPLSNDRIDLDGLSEWRTFCVEGGSDQPDMPPYETSGFLRERSTLLKELNKIAFTGRAEFSFVDGKYGVTIKREQDVPVQMFTPRNSSNFTSTRSFPEDVDGLKFEFKNEVYNYEQDEGVYNNPDKTELQLKGVYKSVELPYVTNPQQALRHGRFAYFEQRLRRETYTLETDVEGLKCTRGDLVLIQNDIIDVGLGSGRAKLIEGTLFQLDDKHELVAGSTYGIQVRHVDGETVQVINGTSTTVPAIETGTAIYHGGGEWEVSTGILRTPDNGDLVVYGTQGIETLECIVSEVEYAGDLTVRLTLVNHAPDLFTIDSGAIPDYEPNLIPRASYQRPYAPSLRIMSTPSELADGTVALRFQGNTRQTVPLRHFLLEARSTIRPADRDSTVITGGWEVIGVTPASEGVVHVALGLDNYWEFRGRALGENDLYSQYSEVVSLLVPSGPADMVQSLTLNEFINTPRSPNADLSTIVCTVVPPADTSFDYANIKYRLQGHPGWITAGRIGPLYDNRVDIVVSSNGDTYEVKATSVSIFGVESQESVSEVITTTNIDEEIEDIPAPPVNGLELFEQGNDTEFVGRDADFVWRKTSVDEWVPIGSEPGTGAGSGRLDLYFKDYEIRIIAPNGAEAHREYRTDNRFTYTYEQNAQDHARLIGGPGAFRAFTIEVRARGRNNQISERPARLSVENPAPELPMLYPSVGFTHASLSYTPPTDRDWTGLKVWMSEISGFTPSDDNLILSGPDTSISIESLVPGNTYYVVYQAFDDFGEGPRASEFSFQTRKVNNSDVDSTPPSIPENLVLTSGVDTGPMFSQSWVKLDWDESTDDGVLTGYLVKYYTDADSTPVEVFTSIPSFRLNDAVPGREYFFSIRAQDWAANKSDYSNEVSIVAEGDSEAPAQPTDISVTAGLDKVIIEWKNPSDSDFVAVRVYRGLNSTFIPDATNLVTTLTGGTDESSVAVDAKVSNGTDYYYKFVSIDASGNASLPTGAVGPVKPFKMDATNFANYFEEAAIKSAYVESLDGGKITANSITTDKFTANAVTADVMSVTTLSSITADLGSVNAGTVTGATVRTNATGARVEMNSTGLMAYNTNGDIPFQLNVDGSGSLGLFYDNVGNVIGGALTWDATGIVTVPGSLIGGEIVGNVIKTSDGSSDWRVELANSGYPIRIWNGTDTKFYVDEFGNAAFNGTVQIGNVNGAGNLASRDSVTWGSGDIAGQPTNSQLYNNLLDPSVWTVGTSGSQGSFSQNGSTAENRIIIGSGPFSSSEALWECVADGGNGADGGWNTDVQEIDHTKTYRSVVWVKRNSVDGSTYLGCHQSHTANLDGTSNGNPYFWSGDLPQLNKWYLLVGVIHGSGYTGGDTGVAGVYDPVTGQKVIDGTEYKNKTTATVQRHRAYLYYTSSTATRQYFARPRLEEVNGNEIPLNVLMGSADVTQTIIDGGLITTGGLQLDGSSAFVRAGKSSFADTATGVWLGRDSSVGKLHVGSSSNYVKFDGTDLVVAVDKLGSGASNGGSNSVAIGSNSNASGGSSVALGHLATASGGSTVSIGYASDATALYSVAVGPNTDATGEGSSCYGYFSKAPGANSTALGRATNCALSTSVAVGANAKAHGTSSIAIGYNAVANKGATSVVGGETADTGDNLALGIDATAGMIGSTAIGRGASAAAKNSIVLGNYSHADSTHTRSVAIGVSVHTTASSQIRLGGSDWHVSIPGDLRVSGNITANYSDVRLKDIIEPLTNNREALKQWETFKYTANDLAMELSDGAYDKNKVEIGLSAQGVQSTHPELVRIAHFDEGDKGVSVSGENYLTVDYSRAVAVVVGAVNEQTDEVEALKSRVKYLEDKLEEVLRKL